MQLLSGADRAPKVTVTAPGPNTTIAGGATIPVSGSATGGSGSYTYTWSATCYNQAGTAVGSGTFANPGQPSTTFTAPAATGPLNCNIILSVVDSCGRFGFGYKSVAVVPPADVQITKTGPATAAAGSIAYTLTVKNNGAITGTTTGDGNGATGVVLSDTVPTGTTFVSVSAPVYSGVAPAGASCSESLGVVTCDLKDMADEQTATVTVTVTAGVGGTTIVNTATVSSTSPDIVLSNNQASATTKVLNSGMKVVKTASPTVVPAAGGPVTFTFTVTNIGDNPLSNVVVADSPTCTISGPVGDTNTNSLLDLTETWVYTCTRTVNNATVDTGTVAFPVDSGPFAAATKQDVVTVTAKDQGNNTITAAAPATVTISSPALSIAKTLAPNTQQPGVGGVATFTITVTNTGNVPLTNVATTDPWTGSCAVASIPNLAVGASYSYSCAATLPIVAATASDSFPVLGANNVIAYQQGTGWAGDWIDSQDTSASGGDIRVIAPPVAGTTTSVAMISGSRTFTRAVNLDRRAGRHAVLQLTRDPRTSTTTLAS